MKSDYECKAEVSGPDLDYRDPVNSRRRTTGTAMPPTRASYSRRHVIAPHCASLANIKSVSRTVSRSSFTQKMTSIYQMLTDKIDSAQGTRIIFLVLILSINLARAHAAMAAATSLIQGRADQTRASGLRPSLAPNQTWSRNKHHQETIFRRS